MRRVVPSASVPGAAPLTLVLGGARSGKSAVAEALAATLPPPVTYVATGRAGDEAMAARIAAHRSRRPSGWATAEAGTNLVAALDAVEGSVLVDSLGTWVAGHDDLAADTDELVAALSRRRHASVVVSDEVGLGVHPSTALGNHFRDVLGEVNAAVATIADHVWLVVAGRVLALPPPGLPPTGLPPIRPRP